MDLLIWAAVCLAIAAVAWVFGYSRYATGTDTLAKFLFALFLALFITILVLGLIGVELVPPPAPVPAA
ncbi:MAG: DUF1328 family protein [Methyloceanibacter sp.]